MKKAVGVILVVFFSLGCARVEHSIKEPIKVDPIKVDISLRVDVYQHVAEEAKSIEEQIFQSDDGAQFFNIFAVREAYAADPVQEAIERRKVRVTEIEYYFQKEFIGENHRGYLEMMPTQMLPETKKKILDLIKEENKDRKTIYAHVAQKNGADIVNTEKIFFKDHYERAPKGYWFEVFDGAQGKYVWEQK